MTQRWGRGTLAGSGSDSSRMMAVMVSAALGRSKARLPVTIWYKTRPKENWSDWKLRFGSPRACSGDM